MSKNAGKEFESLIETSCNNQSIFNFRVRDINPSIVMPSKKWLISKNKFDYLFYYKSYLFPAELKSVNAKSISYSESMIKEFQIKSLTDANKYDGVIPIFIFNFRRDDDKTFALHIEDFNKIKNISENELEHTYNSKLNRSSIPIGICEEIGVEITYYKPRTRKHYYMNKLFDNLIAKYGGE